MKKQIPIESEDIRNYVFPENLQYSPDGGLLAFQCAQSNKDGTGYDRSVWLIKEGEPVRMTYGPGAGLTCWHDNQALVIRRQLPDSEKGMTNLFLLPVSGGEAKPWLSLPFMLQQLYRLSDDIWLATGTIDADDPDAYKDSAETRKQKIADLEKEKDYTVVDEIPYWRNGSGFTNKKRTALFRIELGKKTKIRRLSSPFTSVQTVCIDGMKAYFTSVTWKTKESRMNDVSVYDAESGKKKSLYNRKDRSFSDLFILGGELYCLESDMKQYGLNQTPVISKLTQNTVTPVYTPEIRFGNGVTTDVLLGGGKGAVTAGESRYFLMTKEDRTIIRKFSKNMQACTVFDSPGCVPFLDVNEKGISFCRVSAGHPAEIFTLDENGEALQLTQFNDPALEGRYIALPERVEYFSEETDLWGWVLKPIHFDPKKKYPAILDVHGGPRGAYGEAFYHEMQMWASAGYFVFFTNILGSDGRGDAFADIRGKYGTVDFQNLMDFTDAVLKAYPNIDEKRLCATGGSYGGFMMNWFEGHTSRFCALASQRSIASWISLSFTADIGPWFDPSECGITMDDNLLCEESFAKLWASSPLKDAHNAKTPMLFIHSDEDYRCPLSEGMQMMQALAVQDIETRLVIFRSENHGLSRGGQPNHRIRRLEEITAWFNRFTGNKGE